MSKPNIYFRLYLGGILLFLFFITTLHSAAQAPSVTLVYLDTLEDRTVSRLMEVVLEEQLGMQVTLQEMEVGQAFKAVARGDADAIIGALLPNGHKDVYDTYRRKTTDCGCFYRGVQRGLVVPSFVEVDRISELNSFSGEFKGKILASDPESLISGTTKEMVIPRYDLDYQIEPLDERKLMVELETCVTIREWVVITGWSPHWMFAKWDLKFLKQDLDKLIWKPDNIHIIGRRDLAADNPQLFRFFCNVSFSDDEMNSLLLEVWDSIGSINLAVDQWMEKNQELILSWLS